MSTRSKAELLAELEQRLQQIGALCRPVRHALLDAANAAEPSAIETYLEEILLPLEHIVGCVDCQAFRELCVQLSTVSALSTICSQLGILSPVKDLRLFGFGLFLFDDRLSHLYCLVNYVAFTAEKKILPDASTDIAILIKYAFAHTVYSIAKQADGARLLEDHLGLTRTEYQAENFAPILHNKLVAIAITKDYASFTYISALANALWSEGRQRDAARLLEAHMNFRLDGDLAPTFDEYYEQQLGAYVKWQDSVAYPACAMASAESERVFESPAHSIPSASANDRAAIIDEFRQRLDRLDCLALATKQVILQIAQTQDLQSLRFYLDNVLVVVEEDIAIVENPSFRHLCNSLKLVQDLETFDRLLDCKSIGEPGYDGDTEAAKSLYSVANMIAEPAEFRDADYDSCEMTTALAFSLYRLGYWRRAIHILESRCGLSDPLLYEGDLSKRIADAFDDVKPMAAMGCVEMLAKLLRFGQRHAHAGSLMEAYLNLKPTDYERSDLREILAARWAVLQEDPATLDPTSAAYLTFLASDLSRSGRPRHAVFLLQAHLGINSADYELPGFRETLQRKAWSSRPVFQVADGFVVRTTPALLLNLANAHELSRQHEQAIHLSRIVLRLNDDDDVNFDETRENFLRLIQDGQIDADTLVGFATVLAHTLSLCGQAVQAREILSAVIYLAPASSADVLGGFRAFIKAVSKPTIFDFLSILGKVFFSKPRGCVATLYFIERLLDLPSDSVTKAAISQRLESMQQFVDVDTIAGFVGVYVNCLAACGRQIDAGIVVDVFAGPFAWLDDPDHGPTPESTIFLLDYWLRYHGREDTTKAQSICRRILFYSRRSLRRTGLTREDRARIANRFRSLRIIVVELCRDWAATGPAATVDEWNSLALSLDVELGQRALFERFLAEKVYASAGSDGASLAAGQWPFLEPKPAWIEQFNGHLPDGSGPWSDPTCNEVALAGFDAVADGREEPPPAYEAESNNQEIPWFTEAEGLVTQGLDEGRLAKELGNNSVLLRASIVSNGTLKWQALISDGSTMQVLCDNVKAPSSPADEFMIESAVALHDLEISLAYLEVLIDASASHIRAGCLRQLSVVVQLAADLHELICEAQAMDEIEVYWNEFVLEMNRLITLTDMTFSDALRGLLEHFQTSWPRIIFLSRGEPADLSSKRIGPIWLAAADALKEFQERIAGQSHDCSRVLGQRLDEATSRFLNRVQTAWSLDILGLALRELAVQPDLIIQVDGVLHDVPVAHLSANGQPLYTLVRSARSSLSVLMDVLHRRIEADANQSTHDKHRRQLLTVSWFTPKDRAAAGATILHHGQQALASKHNYDWLAAAEEPPGNWTNVRAGLHNGGPCVATLLGHGVCSKAGVRLADSVWDGRGTNLQGVEWLVVPSCTIGRVRDSGHRDVEGFCVTLTLHRARSALACKWKVNAYETPVFANEVVAQYLALLDAPGADASTGCLRARALNEARKRFLSGNNRRAQAWPGLNTVAAFELYGLG